MERTSPALQRFPGLQDSVMVNQSLNSRCPPCPRLVCHSNNERGMKMLKMIRMVEVQHRHMTCCIIRPLITNQLLIPTDRIRFGAASDWLIDGLTGGFLHLFLLPSSLRTRFFSTSDSLNNRPVFRRFLLLF